MESQRDTITHQAFGCPNLSLYLVVADYIGIDSTASFMASFWKIFISHVLLSWICFVCLFFCRILALYFCWWGIVLFWFASRSYKYEQWSCSYLCRICGCWSLNVCWVSQVRQCSIPMLGKWLNLEQGQNSNSQLSTTIPTPVYLVSGHSEEN